MSNDKKPKFDVAVDDKAPAALVVEAPPSTKDIVKDIISEMMPAFAAAMQMAMTANRPIDPRAERAAVANGPKCHECKQLLKACGGKHKQVVVYPVKYPEFGAWFRGVGINGIWYLSGHAGQAITVPEAAVGDILQQVVAYEENERQTRMGRTAEHNTGTINSPQMAGANAGWR